MPDEKLFQSFFLAGFECSTHRLCSGRRLDLVHATRHDRFAGKDYELLRRHGLTTVREGFRWHLLEPRPGAFDLTTADAVIRPARVMGAEVIWDLWHYGWPDDLDIFSAQFVSRFVAFAKVMASHLSENLDAPTICPINEISFFSWAAGEAGVFFPFAHGRGAELKRQLVRATIAAIVAMRGVNPRIRFCHIDPMINVIAEKPTAKRSATAYHTSQFEAGDMILGRKAPELGGANELIDFVGLNYYIHNQWTHPRHGGSMLLPSDPRYRPVRHLLREQYAHYQKPIFIAETGIEDESRPAWLRYICQETQAAIAAGVPVQGICLYPILNHPGWDDERHCHNGLFDYSDGNRGREVYQPLAEELLRQQQRLARMTAAAQPLVDQSNLTELDWSAHISGARTDESRTEKRT